MVKTFVVVVVLLLIIGIAPNLEASIPLKTFHYVNVRKNWAEARQYCKEMFTDLASVRGQEKDLLTELTRRNVWIGLYRDPGNIWRWTGERGDASRDTNWGVVQPEHACGYLSSDISGGKRWYSTKRCSRPLPFICYTDNLVLVKENKTWEEALEHCRAIGGSTDSSLDSDRYRDHQYDLVSLQSEDDHHHARDRIQEATTNEVWTALRFLHGQWLWVNGEPQQYQNLSLCPAQWRHCGTLPKDNSTQWEIRDCMERRNLLCIKIESPAKPPGEYLAWHRWNLS